MTGYTSGKTTRDPKPYAYPDGRRSPTGGAWGGMWPTIAPRPEFDNHNPVLAVFREHVHAVGDENTPELASEWVNHFGHYWQTSIWRRKRWAAKRHIDHARRVLTKLAALTTNGVAD